MDNNTNEIEAQPICNGSYGDIVIGDTTVMKKLNDISCFPCFIRESSALTLLRKAGVKNIVNVQSIDKHATITMDRWDGNLLDFTLTNEQIYRMTYDILVVMCNMLHLHIAHRDIKPENILVNESKTKIAVCDFGLTRYYSEGTRPQQSTQTVQTSLYRSPELIYPQADPSQVSYNPSNLDIWSLGISLLQLLGLDNMLPPPIESPESSPTDGDSIDPDEYVDVADIPLIYQHLYGYDIFDEELLGETDIDPRFLSLVKRMLTIEYEDRPSPDDLLVDDFFDQYRSEGDIIDATTFNRQRVSQCMADLNSSAIANPDHLTSIVNYDYVNNDTVYLAAMLYYRLLATKVPTDDDALNIIWLALLAYDSEIVYIVPTEVAEVLAYLDYDLYLPIADLNIRQRLDKLLTIV